MSPPRFLVPAPLRAGELLPLPEAVHHHARRVLRLSDGAPIVLFDGAGREFQATLVVDARNESRSRAQILGGGALDREAVVPITLVQALSAQEKIEWLLEKCVELGAARLIFVPAERSVARLDGERRERRAARWRELVAAACAQCGRNRLPPVELAPDLASALRSAQEAQRRWILDPAAAQGLQAGTETSIALAVGPEGGFSAQELALAASLGWEAARMGPRVLRTETAGLAAISALLAQHGEWK
jgi:16S rRNA (uracil1498-N3)-methyltransferase